MARLLFRSHGYRNDPPVPGALVHLVPLHSVFDVSCACSYLERYARALMEPLPENSIIVTGYDMQWTASRYLHICEHVRCVVLFGLRFGYLFGFLLLKPALHCVTRECLRASVPSWSCGCLVTLFTVSVRLHHLLSRRCMLGVPGQAGPSRFQRPGSVVPVV